MCENEAGWSHPLRILHAILFGATSKSSQGSIPLLVELKIHDDGDIMENFANSMANPVVEFNLIVLNTVTFCTTDGFIKCTGPANKVPCAHFRYIF